MFFFSLGLVRTSHDMLHRSRGNLVSVGNKPRAGRTGFDSWQEQWRIFFYSPPRPGRLWGAPGFLSNGNRGLLLRR